MVEDRIRYLVKSRNEHVYVIEGLDSQGRKDSGRNAVEAYVVEVVNSDLRYTVHKDDLEALPIYF